MLYLKSLGIWFLLTISAIIVATFRIKILQPPLGEQTAHQIGTILFLFVQFIIIYHFIKNMKIKETKTLLSIEVF